MAKKKPASSPPKKTAKSKAAKKKGATRKKAPKKAPEKAAKKPKRTDVGHKRPPKEHQFKKGDPRINRKGRPRGPSLLSAMRRLARGEAVTVTIGGKKQEMAPVDALAQAGFKHAIKGDHRFFKSFIEAVDGKEEIAVTILPGLRELAEMIPDPKARKEFIRNYYADLKRKYPERLPDLLGDGEDSD